MRMTCSVIRDDHVRSKDGTESDGSWCDREHGRRTLPTRDIADRTQQAADSKPHSCQGSHFKVHHREIEKNKQKIPVGSWGVTNQNWTFSYKSTLVVKREVILFFVCISVCRGACYSV